jgi:hypothetical protein
VLQFRVAPKQNADLTRAKSDAVGGDIEALACRLRVLLDHLVGRSLQHRWHCQAQRVRRLEIDDQFEFCWFLNWQIAGPFTGENPVHICRHLPKWLIGINTIRREATARCLACATTARNKILFVEKRRLPRVERPAELT